LALQVSAVVALPHTDALGTQGTPLLVAGRQSPFAHMVPKHGLESHIPPEQISASVESTHKVAPSMQLMSGVAAVLLLVHAALTATQSNRLRMVSPK
jgi:hypothetical protein